MIVESLWGLLGPGVYGAEEPWAVAALRGNDLVTVVLVAPTLAVAAARADLWIGWELLWLGGLLYGVYNYAYYALGTQFNDVFLLHVATLALSIVATVALASALDTWRIDPRVTRGVVPRVVAGYMVVVGAAIVTAWGALSVRFALTGQLPEDVMPASAVHLVYALDLALLAPAFLSGGVLLWARRVWGVVLGVAVNAFGAAYLTVLEVVGGYQADAGIDGKTWFSAPAVVGALLCAGAAGVLLSRLGRHQQPAAVQPQQ
jgi:hypothetical protein